MRVRVCIILRANHTEYIERYKLQLDSVALNRWYCRYICGMNEFACVCLFGNSICCAVKLDTALAHYVLSAYAHFSIRPLRWEPQNELYFAVGLSFCRGCVFEHFKSQLKCKTTCVLWVKCEPINTPHFVPTSVDSAVVWQLTFVCICLHTKSDRLKCVPVRERNKINWISESLTTQEKSARNANSHRC